MVSHRKQQLTTWTNAALLLSSLYLLHCVNLVSLKLQQLLDGIFPWVTREPEKCVVIVRSDVVWTTFKTSPPLNPRLLLLTFSGADGVWACVPAEKDQSVSKWADPSFSYIYRITQNRNLLTCPPLGLPCVCLILSHFCWPKCKWRWTKTLKGSLKTLKKNVGQTRFWRYKLTSINTTSIFTFGGKSSSGWKHLAMATSKWIVARRSLLWMTDRPNTQTQIN